MISLSDLITVLPMVGEKSAVLLKKLGISTIEDLLNYYPARHQDFSLVSQVNKLQAGETATIIGRVEKFIFKPTRRRGFSIQEAVVSDGTGEVKLIWFNQPYLKDSITEGVPLAAAGVVERDGKWLTIKNPEYEVYKGLSLRDWDTGPKGPTFQGRTLEGWTLAHTGRLVPVYPETRGITSKWLRTKIALILGILPWYQGRFSILPAIAEWLPPNIISENSFIDLKSAIRQIHFPDSLEKLEQARRRLGFDEILKFQLIGLVRRKKFRRNQAAKPIRVNRESLIVNRFIESLPFQLTGDQNRAIDEILADLSKTTPMNRLLQGDVGSGKTVVAAAAVLMAIKAGYQTAFMAPTQVLADQHEKTLTDLLKPFGVKVALLTGATKTLISEHSENSENQSFGKSENQRAGISGFPAFRSSELSGAPSIPSFPENTPDLIIGTHALIHERAKKLIDPERLALAVIDEQHRFGVEQRAKLISWGKSPHVLAMTATPIPRTLALTIFSHLDVSYLVEMPKGRLKIKTWVVPEEKREAGYDWIDKQIAAGQQAFVLCPLVEGSMKESLMSVKAATKEFEKIKKRFPRRNVDLLHGRMKAGDKTGVLSKMKSGETDILVTTPVVEVGVDVPGATIMVIEGAERFGLAQLHQLRGRVGRNDRQSYCLLYPTNQQAGSKLTALTTIYNGMELAQLDYKFRGGGDIYGTAQHGWPQVKLADLSDMSQVGHAYRIAADLVGRLDQLPLVKNRISAGVDKLVAEN
jgi:ATP-dependent DNA helicase RecG